MTVVSTFRVQVGTPVLLGDDGFGQARIVPILGGSADGPCLTGRILAGGADEQRIRADGLTCVHARYVIEADDGALIRVDSQGLRSGPPEVMAALLAGQSVDPAQVYFRTVIRFETASPHYAALMSRLYLAAGERQQAEVVLRLSVI